MATETTLLILGATGDLASRLLLPALGQLLALEPDRRVRLRGAGIEEGDDAQWRETVRVAFASVGADAAYAGVAETTYHQADITDPAELTRIMADSGDRLALYFAVPPAVAVAACEALTRVELPEGTVLALEKPFGVDETSARALNEIVARLVPEDRVFRVDHFLGRSTLLNVLGARFANRLFDPVWSAEHIESVLVRYDETLGLEDRARYYDRAGALADMIQSHLLQVLAVIAMEPPATIHERDLRDAIGTALRATHVWNDDPSASSRRARYTSGSVQGRQLPSYTDEHGVDASRGTETLAELVCEVRNSRWAGVPFTLRSGKALAAKNGEIVVRFRPVNHVPEGLTGDAEGAVLRFSLGPDRMDLELNVNGGDDPFVLERATLSADLGAGSLRAYGEVLSGILDADATLSVRGDAAERSWHIVDPVLAAWRRGDVPLEEYPAGSHGPEAWPSLS